uniref:Uncharacterized protein n=1 Tax=Cacopsylla melanoneura TaxID=428564 RepID=A0A8D9EUT8_9HEMI
MGSVCCKQGHLPQDHTVTSYYTKPSPGDLLCKEIKSQFRLCPNRRQQKIKQRRRFKKRNLRKERPSISSPRLLNPKYLTGEKWQNVILTIPDPKMKTRTPVPPPRKKRKSLINLCTKRNESIEYVNLPSNEDDDWREVFENNNLLTNKLYSSDLELFKPINRKEQKHSNLRRTVSYEDMTSLNAFYHVIKTSHQHVLNSYIHTCLLCYINEIMSLVEQLNRTNNEETKFKLDDSDDENDEVTEKQVMCESERQDGTQVDKETKLSEINEQKLLESLENFCIHCYLNKIQTHPKEREDVSSTCTKVKENNLKSFQTGDNNNFSRANKNVGNKITLMGSTHDKTKFSLREIEKDKESACANSMQAEEESSKQPQIEYSLDKKYQCLFCCINKKKTKQKHYSSNGGSLYEIYSKKQENNVFKSDNINEQECKYTIGNNVGDKVGNKIRNEKLCEINNAQNKHIHDSNNMLEHFKILNCCRRRHLNLFRFMCFQCFYVYVQIVYILQNSASFNEDSTSSIFKMRKCEMMRSLSLKNIAVIVSMVQQIHSCYNGRSIESNACQSCAEVLFPRERNQPTVNQKIHSNKNQTGHEESGSCFIDLKQNKVPPLKDSLSHKEILLKEQGKRLADKQEVSQRKSFISTKKYENKTRNIEHHHDTTQNNCIENLSAERQQTVRNITNSLESVQHKSALTTKILQNFEKTNDPSVVERRQDKFKKLMADLNSTKIGAEETMTDDRSQLIGKDRSRGGSEERIIDKENRNQQKMESRDLQSMDNNGNYWNSKEVVNQSDDPPEKTKCQQDLVQDPVKQLDDNIQHIKRNSIKRKSYKLKRPPENNPSEYPQQSTMDLSRKSSVSDSLYELEASLYEMLQNSPYFAMDDVEYV